MLLMSVYILYVPSKNGDWQAYYNLYCLCRRAQNEGWTPIPMVTMQCFEDMYATAGLSVEETFKRTHQKFFDGGIDSLLSLWIDGNGSSAYARDVIAYAFANDLEVHCFSPKGSLMERYMRPFFIEQIKRTEFPESLQMF